MACQTREKYVYGGIVIEKEKEEKEEEEEEVKERFKEGVKVLSETSLQWILHGEMLAWASNKQFEAF